MIIKPKLPKILNEPISIEIEYTIPKAQVVKNIANWAKTKEAKVFLKKGLLNNVWYTEHRLFKALVNSMSNEIEPVKLIDKSNFIKPNKKQVKLFQDSMIENKQLTNQVAFNAKMMRVLLSNNGIWNKNSLFYERVDYNGKIINYYEYDNINKRIYEIPLSKLYSASFGNPSYIRTNIMNELSKGEINILHNLARVIPELRLFIESEFDILLT